MPIQGTRSADAVRAREQFSNQMNSRDLTLQEKKAICLEALKKGTISKEEAGQILCLKCGVPLTEVEQVISEATSEKLPNLNGGRAVDALKQAFSGIGNLFSSKAAK